MSIKITWLGHASLRVETGGYQLLVDPFLTDNPMGALSAAEAQADYILLSHGHGDHVGDTVEIAQHTGATVITNFEIGGWLDKKGVKNHTQHIGGGYHHPFGYLKFTQAVHGSGLPDGSYGGNPAGFLLTSKDGKKSIYRLRHRFVWRYAPDRRGRPRPGSIAYRRQLHHGARRCAARGALA